MFIMEPGTDARLWRLAQKRAAFKKSATSYVIMNLFFWVLWWMTSGRNGVGHWAGIWPIWPMLGWGLGLAFQWSEAYGSGDRSTAVQREYDRLKNEQGRV